MYKSRLSLDQMTKNPKALTKVKNQDIVQILDKNSEAKVLMTQEHFFSLMERLERAEGTIKTTPYKKNLLKKEVDQKTKEVRKVLKPSKKRYPVIKQTWTESEAGWGQRDAGYSLHLNEEAMNRFNKKYWDSQPKGPAPAEYIRPDENPTKVYVGEKTYLKIKKARNGIRL